MSSTCKGIRRREHCRHCHSVEPQTVWFVRDADTMYRVARCLTCERWA